MELSSETKICKFGSNSENVYGNFGFCLNQATIIQKILETVFSFHVKQRTTGKV